MKSTTSETGQKTTETTATASVFRTKTTEAANDVSLPETNPNQPTGANEKADGLFVGYETDNDVPFVADYYGITDTYKGDKETYPEVAEITEYLNSLVRSGELDNSLTAVRTKLKTLEKLAGVDITERVNIKLIRLAEFAKFQNRVNLAKLSR